MARKKASPKLDPSGVPGGGGRLQTPTPTTTGRSSTSRPKGRPKSATPKKRRPVNLTVRGGEDWKAWLESAAVVLARKKGVGKFDVSDVIDVALGLFAREMGIEPPPERY